MVPTFCRFLPPTAAASSSRERAADNSEGKQETEATEAAGHLRHIVSEYVAYHNEERPHQGAEPAIPLAEIGCEQRLGGLLRHYYYRKAA